MPSLSIEAGPASPPSYDRADSKWIVRFLCVGMFASLALAFVLDKMDPDHPHGIGVIALGITAILLGSVLVLLDCRVGISLFILVGCISPRFGENFRLEDLLLPAIIMVWVGRTVRGDRFYIKSPITVPFIIVSLTMVLSLLWGIAQSTVPRPLDGVFIAAKRIEYGLLFLFAMNSVRTREDGRKLLMVFLGGAILAAVISMGSAGNDATVGDTRITGLDEENYNTFAGFVVIATSLALCGAFHFRGKLRLVFSLVTLLMIATLLKTYSREGYFMLAAALAVLGVIRYRVLVPIILVLVMFAQFILPDTVIDRALNSVNQIQNYRAETAGRNSFTARVTGWQGRWAMFEHQPIFGNGPGSVPLHIDNEYLLRLIEEGIVGLVAFAGLMVAYGWYLFKCIRRLRGTESEPFAYALFAAFVAMLLQGTVAAAWSTIRTMEPFWILTGALGGLVIYGAYSNPPGTEQEIAGT